MRIESHQVITATELARNLAAAIDQVRLNRRSLWITKGSQTVAELGPPPKAGYPITQLADLLASLPRSQVKGNVHDLQIAATAVTHGFAVLTSNVNDFRKIPGLVVESPV